jgi:hypothetical protein
MRAHGIQFHQSTILILSLGGRDFEPASSPSRADVARPERQPTQLPTHRCIFEIECSCVTKQLGKATNQEVARSSHAGRHHSKARRFGCTARISPGQGDCARSSIAHRKLTSNMSIGYFYRRANQVRPCDSSRGAECLWRPRVYRGRDRRRNSDVFRRMAPAALNDNQRVPEISSVRSASRRCSLSRLLL